MFETMIGQSATQGQPQLLAAKFHGRDQVLPIEISKCRAIAAP